MFLQHLEIRSVGTVCLFEYFDQFLISVTPTANVLGKFAVKTSVERKLNLRNLDLFRGAYNRLSAGQEI